MATTNYKPRGLADKYKKMKLYLFYIENLDTHLLCKL